MEATAAAGSIALSPRLPPVAVLEHGWEEECTGVIAITMSLSLLNNGGREGRGKGKESNGIWREGEGEGEGEESGGGTARGANNDTAQRAQRNVVGIEAMSK